MITALIVFKEKLKYFYAKGSLYIRHVLLFALAFVSLLIISKAMGGNGIIDSPLICLAISLVCAFLTINVTVVVTTIYIIVHLFGISIELAVIATCVILLLYLLYFRFAPKTGFLLILTPIFFLLKVPYVVPVIAGLTVGMTGIIPVIGGVFIYFLTEFASYYSNTVTTFDPDNALQNINYIIGNILTNKEMIVLMASFAVVITIIFLVKKLSVNYSWIIAIVAGSIIDAIIQIISYTMFDMSFGLANMIVGHIVAIAVGLILNLFLFSVDYSATEMVQFEDDDYVYYVKAIPKIEVTSKNVTVKKINTHNEDSVDEPVSEAVTIIGDEEEIEEDEE